MTQQPFTIPTWAPATAAIAIVVWAASVWWMVATLPNGGDTGDIEAVLDSVVTELESANVSIEALTLQIGRLEDERDALAARVGALERRGPVDAAFPMSSTGAAAEDGETVPSAETSPFFTDGADRYNCRNFTSMADAQEALEVNRPGDPNRIDGNNNGLACEDFKYPADSATPTPTPVATSQAP